MSQEEIAVPKGWESEKLKDVCETIASGGTPSRDEPEYYDGNIPWVKIGDLNNSKIFNSKEKISQFGLDNSSAKLFPKDTVLFAMYGGQSYSSGITGIAKIACTTNQAICGMICGKKLDPYFLLYFLQCKIDEIRKMAIGGAQLNMNQTMMKNLEIYFPSLKIQKQIIAKLDHILGELEVKKKQIISLIEQNRERIKYLNEKLIDDVIDEVMKFKSPKENWETGTVDDFKNKQYIIEFQDGNHGELHPKKNDFSNTGRYFITASQIDVKGILHLEKCRRLPEEFCQKLRIGFAEPNDVLFSHNATVGRVSIIPPSASSSIVGTSVTYYRLNPKMINQKFFFYLLRSRFIRNQYESKMKQTTRNQFSKLKQAKLNLIIPSLNEQKTLIKKLEKLFDEMNDYSPKLADLLIKYESQIKYINHIQSSVLDSAFSGKLLN